MNIQISITARDRKNRTCQVSSMTVAADNYEDAYKLALPHLLRRIKEGKAGSAGRTARGGRSKLPAARKPKTSKPVTGWAAVAADPDLAEPVQPPQRFPGHRIPKPPTPPTTKAVPMARVPKQADPFDDLEIRAPINTEYMGVGRRKAEPREEIKITGAGLAKRRIVKPKEDVQGDIFADLLIGEE